MGKITLLHLILVVVVIGLLIFLLRSRINHWTTPVMAPPTVLALPQHHPAVVKPGLPGRFVFPLTMGRVYKAGPRVDEKLPTDIALAQGHIEVTPAHKGAVVDQQIAPAPQQIKLQWIFALP